MSALNAVAPIVTISPRIHQSQKKIQYGSGAQCIKCTLAGPDIKFHPFLHKRSISLAWQSLSSVVAGATTSAVMYATCAAEQTQTVTRQSSTITVAPIKGEEKSPELDDGGTGFPPRDDGDGGGGGGGGGGAWSGGFFFFGLLAFLGFLKDKEGEDDYSSSRRRR